MHYACASEWQEHEIELWDKTRARLEARRRAIEEEKVAFNRKTLQELIIRFRTEAMHNKMKKPLMREVKDGNKFVLKHCARIHLNCVQASSRWYIDPVTGEKVHFNMHKKPNGEIIHGY